MGENEEKPQTCGKSPHPVFQNPCHSRRMGRTKRGNGREKRLQEVRLIYLDTGGNPLRFIAQCLQVAT